MAELEELKNYNYNLVVESVEKIEEKEREICDLESKVSQKQDKLWTEQKEHAAENAQLRHTISFLNKEIESKEAVNRDLRDKVSQEQDQLKKEEEDHAAEKAGLEQRVTDLDDKARWLETKLGQILRIVQYGRQQSARTEDEVKDTADTSSVDG